MTPFLHFPDLTDRVRRYDRDRFLSSLFLPADSRAALHGILAFNLEIARVMETVSDPMLGLIRLQWWREAIEGLYNGTARKHEVVDALALIIPRYALPQSLFDEVITAREEDVQEGSPETIKALVDYATITGGFPFKAAMHIVGEGGSPEAMQAAEKAGAAWALTGLLRVLPIHAQRNKSFLPLSLLQEAGVTVEQLAQPGEAEEVVALQQLCLPIIKEIRHNQLQARETRPLLSPVARRVLLSLRLVDNHVKHLENNVNEVWREPISPPSPRMLTRLYWGAFRGKY